MKKIAAFLCLLAVLPVPTLASTVGSAEMLANEIQVLQQKQTVLLVEMARYSEDLKDQVRIYERAIPKSSRSGLALKRLHADLAYLQRIKSQTDEVLRQISDRTQRIIQ